MKSSFQNQLVVLTKVQISLQVAVSVCLLSNILTKLPCIIVRSCADILGQASTKGRLVQLRLSLVEAGSLELSQLTWIPTGLLTRSQLTHRARLV